MEFVCFAEKKEKGVKAEQLCETDARANNEMDRRIVVLVQSKQSLQQSNETAVSKRDQKKNMSCVCVALKVRLS